jgi:hypothetical protein
MLSRYMDGDLSPPAAQEVREHVAACAACTRALQEMQAMDEAVRRSARASAEAPDVADRVVAELHHRGAFFRARVNTGKRRLFGESLLTFRMVGALAAAAVVMAAALLGTDYLTREAWVKRTTPVVADAQSVLVRLVAVEPGSEEASRLATAREQAREMGLSVRLAEARSGADPALAGDLSYLETTFALLARGDPLPAHLQDDLRAGEALNRARHVLEVLGP